MDEVETPVRCDVCGETMQLLTFDEAAPDYWPEPTPADDDLVWWCPGCGTFGLALRWTPPA
jgi:hypothetical protein